MHLGQNAATLHPMTVVSQRVSSKVLELLRLATMKIYCNGRALIEHAVSDTKHEIFADELVWEPMGGTERQMGLEALYEATVIHDELGELRWSLAEYPLGIENYKNTDVGKHRLIEDVDYGLEHERDNGFGQETYASEERIENTSVEGMVRWFHNLYEDPQNETPYDNEKGRYHYVNGGPFDAEVVLQEKFGNIVSDHIIEQAVSEIESSGTIEWAPSPSHPEQLNADLEHKKLKRRTGSGLFVKREAQELLLNRESLALGLAHLFKSATGEFSFALLGAWGSGKTTLASTISQYLLNTEKYSKGVKREFGVSEANQKRYAVVEFNAWKYQRKPELWVYLYESFLSDFLSTSFFQRTLRVVRVGLQKNGVANALFSLLILAFSAFPLMWISSLFPYANAVFGVSGVVGLVFLARRWHASLRKLYDLYGVVSSHREHLGMQAVIGEDLRAIVKSQVNTPQFTKREKLFSGAAVMLVGVTWLTFAIQADGTGSKMHMFAPLLIWIGVGVVFLCAMTSNSDRVDRILLIVDDLDRCPKEEILDLIDGVKLMVEDDEIGEFVQVLTLADTDILCSAIQTKFSFHENATETSGINTRVVEHLQKVFLCHLRLPIISNEDVMDLVQKYASEFGVEEHENSPTPDRENRDESPSSHAMQTGPNSAEDLEDFILSVSEVNFVKAALGSHVNKHKIEMTPRSVRSFLFKYQILRMILRLNGVSYDHQDLVEHLGAEIAISLGASVLSDVRPPTYLSQYVKMVA